MTVHKISKTNEEWVSTCQQPWESSVQRWFCSWISGGAMGPQDFAITSAAIHHAVRKLQHQFGRTNSDCRAGCKLRVWQELVLLWPSLSCMPTGNICYSLACVSSSTSNSPTIFLGESTFLHSYSFIQQILWCARKRYSSNCYGYSSEQNWQNNNTSSCTAHILGVQVEMTLPLALWRTWPRPSQSE